MTISSTMLPSPRRPAFFFVGRQTQEAEGVLAQLADDLRVVVDARLRQNALHEGEERLRLAANVRHLELAAPRRFLERALVVALVVAEDLLHLVADLGVGFADPGTDGREQTADEVAV